MMRVTCAMAVGIGVALAACVFSGCNRAPMEPPPADPARSIPGETVQLKVVDEKAFAEALAAHRGHPVLVDYWATWCKPCVQLFPHSVELAHRYGTRGLVVMSVSLNDPDDESDVRAFLAAKGATFENFLSRYGASAQAVTGFQINDGTIPLLRLYDADGKLVRTFGSGGDPPTPEGIDHAVAALVGG